MALIYTLVKCCMNRSKDDDDNDYYNRGNETAITEETPRPTTEPTYRSQDGAGVGTGTGTAMRKEGQGGSGGEEFGGGR